MLIQEGVPALLPSVEGLGRGRVASVWIEIVSIKIRFNLRDRARGLGREHQAAFSWAAGFGTRRRGAASAIRAATQACIFRTETALPICLILSVLVPANS